MGATDIILNSLLSGFISGCFAIFFTFIIEKLGGRIGGTISTIPFIFLSASYAYLTSATREEAMSSLAYLPWGCHADVCLLFTWKTLPKYLPERFSHYKKMSILLITSLLIWLTVAISFILIFSAIKDYLPSYALAWIGFTTHMTIGICASFHLKPSTTGKNKVTVLAYGLRGLFALITIFVSGILVRTGNGLIGSIAAIFPAIYITAMVSMWISQGEKVMLGVAGPMSIGGLSWSGYSATLLMVSFYIDKFSPIVDIIIALLIDIVCVSIPISGYLYWREKVAIKNMPESENNDNINTKSNENDKIISLENGNNNIVNLDNENINEQNNIINITDEDPQLSPKICEVTTD